MRGRTDCAEYVPRPAPPLVVLRDRVSKRTLLVRLNASARSEMRWNSPHGKGRTGQDRDRRWRGRHRGGCSECWSRRGGAGRRPRRRLRGLRRGWGRGRRLCCARWKGGGR